MIALYLKVAMAVLAGLTQAKMVLLPCDPLIEARPRECEWLDGKLQSALKEQIELIPRKAVMAAMAAKGLKRAKDCDDACLIELGKTLGAARVVRQTLSMQDKQQSQGVVWIWTMHQIDVRLEKEYGHFARMCMCSKTAWDTIARQHAKRLLEFDESKRLVLKSPAKAVPTKGPVDIPGMVYVPAGEFIMGAEWGEWDEEPRHKVYVDAFYFDKYETTNEEYARCVAARKCVRQTSWAKPSLMKPTQPVVGVGWYDGVEYCRFAGKRLPTEAEWEKAARGTDERRYPWGNEWNPKWLNLHNADDGFETTSPVGSFPQNVSPYGAYDMAGNAWEWVHDFHERHYYEYGKAKNPKGPPRGEKHSMRGGSWMYDVPIFNTTTNRSPGNPLIRKKYVGFRCAKGAP
ncbi:MAG: formylglycine-generating enzyme family protein [Proteobacteria bacterium]|nr:formylglycine-generating enzyme family protein [Pseudomonadota bacterium]